MGMMMEGLHPGAHSSLMYSGEYFQGAPCMNAPQYDHQAADQNLTTQHFDTVLPSELRANHSAASNQQNSSAI
jgi:hypothetical protein